MSIQPHLSVCQYSVSWVWVVSVRWWWTGRSGVLWSMGSQRVRHDWVTELNWTVCMKILTWLDQFFLLLLLLLLFFSFLVSFLKNFCGSYDYPPQYSCLGISWIEEPGKLESIGSQKIRHVWVTKTFLVFSILYSYRNFYHLFFSFVSESICIFLVKIWST